MTQEMQLIEALTQPTAYPYQPDHVSLLQTHISLLFFAGDRVYKVKKPVDMGFLDYTTIEKRRHFCEEEVRLNRRLARYVYLGVVRIVRGTDGEIRVVRNQRDADADGETIDYAVEMSRLPDDRMLPALIEREEVGDRAMREIAELLVKFHAECPTGPDIDQYATVDSLHEQASDNFEQLQSILADHAANAEFVEHVRGWSERFLQQHRDLIEQRIARGRVREGHGDLHAGNICLLDDQVIIYDCIEFTPKFRCRDVAGELGFLAMDMDYRGHGELGRALIEYYATLADDREMLDLLGFFKVHFAIVRAKVAAIKSTEREIEPAERNEAAREALRYLHLAVGYTIRPALIVMCGLPATGKSTVANKLARALGAAVFRADEIRKELAGIAPTERGDDSIYSNTMTDRTYATLGERAAQTLRDGDTAIADATFATSRRRDAIINIAREAAVPWLIVHTTAANAAIRQRMDARAADDREVSDADWQVYQRIAMHFQPPDEIPASHLITVRDRADVDSVVEQALLALVRRLRQQRQ